MALLACLCTFQHLFTGLTNRTLRPQIAELSLGSGAVRRARQRGKVVV
jgi:hypothetical protein